jgi:transposase InsO family protein
MKLQPFGIEIYAAIDGYSRYIVWVYIGISARTAISVLRQGTDAFETRGFQPRKFRSDRGVETVLLANSQYKLRQAAEASPSIKPKDCWIYGRSVDNQRIEAWWGMLSRATTGLFHISEVFILYV